jgi:transcriptional regulator with XRE-family HTH domain
MVQKLIGKRIKMYRMAKGLTQEELAEKIGLSRNYYSAAERGVYSLNLDKVVEIINILDCSADEIFADVINNGYKIKTTILSEKLSSLPKDEQERILSIVDTLVTTAKHN